MPTLNSGYRRLRIPRASPLRALVTTRTGQVYEHRLVMAIHLGRPLADDEAVHHRDGNRLRNVIDNLEVVAWDEHAHRHWRKLRRDARGRFRARHG